ncbi:hypothetical protein VTO42DRAFT_5537 [Malbranchea cinnamomea]
MDVWYAYTYATAGWLGLQGISLLAAPKMIITVLQDEPRPSTSLEIYFSRSLGLSLLAMSLINLILTGSVALTSSVSVTAEETDPTAPFATPSIMTTSLFHAAAAFYTYSWFVEGGGQMAFGVAMIGYGLLAFAGLWCLMFARSGGRISKKTGADKRVSGFPFRNVEADKKKGKGKEM